MIKFFRKKRHKLTMEGNLPSKRISFKRYLFYAIGETLLIVLGILLALQVNNWNDQLKDDYKAQKILFGLYNEFTENKDQIIKVSSYHVRVKNACTALLNLISQNPAEIKESVMDSLLAEYGYFLSYDPYNSILNAAISSGDIHFIENDSLLNLLFSWAAIVSDAREEEVQSKQLLFQHKGFLSKYVREVNIWKYPNSEKRSIFKSNYSGLLNHPDFENKVHFRLSVVEELVKEQKAILDSNNRILSLLAKEMK